MARISLIALVLVVWATCSVARAQCQGGGASGGTSTASAATTGGTSTSGTASAARLLTGPGSLAYDVVMAQAIQRQVAQRQYIAALQKQAKRQADLKKRRYAAAHARQNTQEQRARMYAFLAEKYGSPKQATSATYQTAYHTTGY